MQVVPKLRESLLHSFLVINNVTSIGMYLFEIGRHDSQRHGQTMISSSLKNKLLPIGHGPILHNPYLILILLDPNTNLLQVLDDEMDAVGFLDALVGNIEDGERLQGRGLDDGRDDEDCEGHEGVRAVVEIQTKGWGFVDGELMKIVVEEEVALHGFAGKGRNSNVMEH